MNEKNKGIRATVRALKVNEKAVFDLNTYKYNSIRATTFALDVEEDKKFTTRLNRADRTITVTRLR